MRRYIWFLVCFLFATPTLASAQARRRSARRARLPGRCAGRSAGPARISGSVSQGADLHIHFQERFMPRPSSATRARTGFAWTRRRLALPSSLHAAAGGGRAGSGHQKLTTGWWMLFQCAALWRPRASAAMISFSHLRPLRRPKQAAYRRVGGRGGQPRRRANQQYVS